MTDYAFDQLIDIEQARQLMESHHRLSGMAYGLFDAHENNLIAVGWQDICVRFHRINPVTFVRCRESDAFIKAQPHDLQGVFPEYRCKNGMIDIAMPIIIDGRHLATFFTGQFFYEDDLPDRDFFVTQAAALGFDTDDYLKALEQVPVFSRKYIRGNVLFLHNMVRVLAETGLKHLALARETEERKRMEDELQRKNSEFERFTYMVSHDLKSPIITIKSFSGSIKQDLCSGRHDRVEKDLDRIRAAADKMAALLDDLPKLSRSDRIIDAPVSVDMTRLINDVPKNMDRITP